jgi:hypothetical protein
MESKRIIKIFRACKKAFARLEKKNKHLAYESAHYSGMVSALEIVEEIIFNK